jgi:hypothetical protein
MYEAFYAVVATSAAALFGIGGTVLSGRFLALSERAARLDTERGDRLNRSVSEGIQETWAMRAREDSIADLHDLTRRLRIVALLPLCAAALLTITPLIVLAGWLPDKDGVRGALILVFALATGAWVCLLWAHLMRPVERFTRVWHRRPSNQMA